MEKIGCICMMSGLVKAMAALENSLMDIHGLSLNEAVVLCCIGDSEVSAGAVADSTGPQAFPYFQDIERARGRRAGCQSLGARTGVRCISP